MNSSNHLLKNTFIYIVGNFGSRVLSLLLVPLYSFYLSKSDMGYFDLVNTTISLLIPFITLQISDASYRWLLGAKGDIRKQNSAISNGFFLMVITVLFFFIIYVLVSPYVRFDHLFLFGVMLFFATLLPFFQQVIRGLGKNRLYSVFGIVNTLLLVVFTVCFLVISKWGLKGLLIASALSNFFTCVLIFFLVKMHRKLSVKMVSKSEIKLMLNYSWPLIPNTVCWYLINEVNRFIILFKLGADANGIFAIANRFPSIIIIVNSIFILAWQDHAINNYDSGHKDAFNSKVFKVYMCLELTLVILLTTLSKYMVKNFIGSAFYDSWKYIPLLYVCVAFSSFSAFLGASYLGAKKTRGIFTTTVIGSVINVVISYFFIDSIGLYAPVLGTMTGFFTIWIVRIYQTKDFFKLKVDYAVFFFLFFTALITIKAVYAGNVYVDIMAFAIAIIVFLIFNSTLLKYLLSFTKQFIKNKKTTIESCSS